MTRTKSVRRLVEHHLKTDPKFAEALLIEGIDSLLSGDADTGKAILRYCVKRPGNPAVQHGNVRTGPNP